MNILKNDKVVLIKQIERLNKIGNIYEIASITDTKIVIRDRDSKVALVAVEIEEFDKYFKKDNEVNGWTDWIGITDGVGNLEAYYRTNQKRVEVKTVDGKFKGKSSCNKTDTFSLEKGIKLAMTRCKKKIIKCYMVEAEREKLKIEQYLKNSAEEIDSMNKFIARLSN